MSNEEALQYIDEGMKALTCAMPKVKQALSSANIAVGQAEAYNQGLNDAWELAWKLYAMKIDDMQAVFGAFETELEVMNYLTPQEALARLEAYEKEQAEIKVGDVVSNDGLESVVVRVVADKIYTVTSIGTTPSYAFDDIKKLTKTGKHIDIQSVLQQIGGGSDEW